MSRSGPISIFTVPKSFFSVLQPNAKVHAPLKPLDDSSKKKDDYVQSLTRDCIFNILFQTSIFIVKRTLYLCEEILMP